MEESKRKAGPGVYVRVCGGDFVAGSFLYRMAFLMPKARIRIEGKAWYVNSRRQMMAYWGCSERQYKKAIRFLRTEGLIETRYTAGFGKPQALRTTAFRLTDKAIEAIESETQCELRSREQQKALSIDEESCDTAREVSARRNEQFPGRDTADPSGRSAIGPSSRDAVDPIHIKKRSESERDELTYLRRSRNANSDQGILEQECSRKGSKAKIDPKEVERVFVEARLKSIAKYPKMYGPKDRVHIAWGPRLFRMANQFTRKVQIAAAEAGIEVDPLDVVAKCVDRWSSFRESAFDKYRVKMAEKPVMPSLLAAVQPAVEFYLRERERTVRYRPKLPRLAEMYGRDKPSTSPRSDSPICEEGTLVDVDDQGDVTDTSPQLNASPAPAPTSPERLVALAQAYLWPRGMPGKRPEKNITDRRSSERK
jgi:hypothetical protein